MGGEHATMVFADPPYNLRIALVQGRGRIKHREFSKASGEMTPSEFTEFLTDSMRLAVSSSENGAGGSLRRRTRVRFEQDYRRRGSTESL